jgi:short-subunit dehydrogenase
MRDAREFCASYGPWAVIAGGTTGAGEAYSHQLAARGLNLVIIGLEPEKLEMLAKELPAEHSVSVRTANVDLSSAEVLEEVRRLTSDIEVGLLVYNACYLAIGEFVDTDLDSHLKALYVNCRGPMVLSHLLGTQMAERGRGGILLMASLLATQGASLLASYSADPEFRQGDSKR